MNVRAASPESFLWLTARTGYIPGADFRGIVAVGRDGLVRGLVGFDRWTPNAAYMHVAVDSPGGSRHLLRAAFGYLFGQCGRTVALATIRESNAPSLRLAQRVGFVETSRTLDGWAAGESLIHLELRRDACRWR